MKKTNQKGFTLIELLLVLAIIAALAVAAFIIFPRVQASNAATSNATILNAAAAQIQALFPSARYSNLSTQVACRGDVFPENMKMGPTCATTTSAGANTDLQNEWQGNITVNGATAAGAVVTTTAARYYRIDYANVPTKVCSKLAPALASNFGIVAIGPGAWAATAPAAGDTVVNTFNGATTTDDVLNEATVQSRCAAAAAVNITVVGR